MLHVIHAPAHNPSFYHRNKTTRSKTLEELAHDWMKEFLGKTRTEHPDNKPLRQAMVTFVSGLPSGRIAEIGKKVNARLIVVGGSTN